MFENTICAHVFVRKWCFRTNGVFEQIVLSEKISFDHKHMYNQSPNLKKIENMLIRKHPNKSYIHRHTHTHTHMTIIFAHIYFVLVFGAHIYAYYLYNQIAEQYGNSAHRCEDLPRTNIKFFPIFSNTIMFLMNIMIFRTIINYLSASFQCRKINSFENFPMDYFVKCSDEKICFLLFGSFIYGSFLILTNIIVFNDSCFVHNFPHENRLYVLITSVLGTSWCFNISIFWGMAKFSLTNVDGYYIMADYYKTIGINYRFGVGFGIVICFLVSGLLFDWDDAQNQNQHYVQTMFLIGTITNLINTYVLINEKYAEITVCGFTICSTVINSIIFGYIIGMGPTLSSKTIISLGMANIFTGIYIGFVPILVLKILLFLTIYSIALISLPVMILGLGLLLFAQLLYKLFNGVCINADFDDDAYFQSVYDQADVYYENFLKKCEDCVDCIWDWTWIKIMLGLGSGTGSGSGTETVTELNQVLTQETNVLNLNLNPNTAPDDETPV